MGFDSGTIAFKRYVVTGNAPGMVDETLLDKLAGHALKEQDLGLPPEIEWGWCGGRHVLDNQFTFERNVFNDSLVFGLRIDTNKVPGELKKAWTSMEEDATAAGNPSGFISKAQKKNVKETIRRKFDDELRSGRFRKSKMSNVLWDLPNATLFGPSSLAVAEKLGELFERTFEVGLQPIGSGEQALRVLEGNGKRREYEDLVPTRFVVGPNGDGQPAEYPWTAKGASPKDFLGNEFVLWLWHTAEHSGFVKTDKHDVAVMFEKALDLDCAYGQTGRDGLRGDSPIRMPEAMDALRSGKVPRKATMQLERSGHAYAFSLTAESLVVSGLRLPEVEEADNPRTLFEERITLLRDFVDLLDETYAAFLKVRAGGGWESHVGQIRKWILTSARPATAVA
jgi:hypothetical protein